MRQPRSLEVDQQDVEGVHHRRRRPPNRAVQTEDRDAVAWIDETGDLNHVVLFVAARRPLLRAEGGGEPDVADRREHVKRVSSVVVTDAGWRAALRAANGQGFQVGIGKQRSQAKRTGMADFRQMRQRF